MAAVSEHVPRQSSSFAPPMPLPVIGEMTVLELSMDARGAAGQGRRARGFEQHGCVQNHRRPVDDRVLYNLCPLLSASAPPAPPPASSSSPLSPPPLSSLVPFSSLSRPLLTSLPLPLPRPSSLHGVGTLYKESFQV